MDIVWISHPDNYRPATLQDIGAVAQERLDLFAEHGYALRVVQSHLIVPGWAGGPRLWVNGEDLLDERRGFMVTGWTWDAAAATHISAISRAIRASSSVLLTDGILDPERLGGDKLAMYHFAGERGVPVLPTVSVPWGRHASAALEQVARHLGGDGYVVKPREMARGFGVLKVDTIEQLAATIDLLTPSALGCVVQPYYANSGDLRVYVHRGEVIAGLLRKPAPGGYLANISQGGSGSAMSVPADIRAHSERLAGDLDSPYLCIDWLLSDAGPIFNEWMTVSAAFENLPEPEKTKVSDALFATIADRLAGTD